MTDHPQDLSAATVSQLERKHAIIESAIDFAIVATDLQGRLTAGNSGAAHVLGWSAEEMVGQSAERFFTPEDRAAGRLEIEMQQSLAKGRASDERWHLRKDGQRFWASGELMPLKGADGDAAGFIKILRDRTVEHQARIALQQTESRLRRAQQAARVGVFDVDVENGIVHATPEFCRLFGLPERDEIPAGTFESLVVPEDVHLVSHDATRRSGVVPADVEYRIRRADTGELRWIARKGEIEVGPDGRPARFVGVARDITDEVVTQQNLRNEREQLAQMFEQAPTFMVILRGRDHRFERVNPGYVRLIGGRDVVGKTVAEALPEAAAQGFLTLLDTVFESGEPFSATGVKFAVQALPGGPVDERYLDFVYQPIRDGKGTVTGIFVEGADVTDRRRASDALAVSEERYRTLFSAIDTGFCIVAMRFDAAGTAVDYRIVEGNAAFERMTGLSGSAGKWISEIAPGLERHWFDRYGKVALTGESVRFENHAAVFGRWYDVQALRIGDPLARRVAILFNDITQRKKLESRQEALLLLSDILRDLTEPGEIAFAASAVLGKTLDVSRIGYGIIDTVAETITIERDWNAPGITTIAGVLHFRDYGSYIENLKRGETVAIADARADDRTRENADALRGISASSFVNMPLVEQGRFVALIYANHAEPRAWDDDELSLMREVADRVRSATERARSDQASRESEEQFRAFAQVLPNQIWAARADGHLYWFNDQVYAYTATRPGELDGTDSWRRLVHPDDLEGAGPIWAHCLAVGNDYETEFRIRRSDGAYRWFLVRAKAIRSSDGTIARWVGSNTDIEDQKRHASELLRLNETLEDQVASRTKALMETEEVLRQSQKMEAVGQLTGGLAHDFNNLLVGIGGSLELLSARIAQGRYGEVERHAAAAQGAARRAAALTHRLLAFSRRQTLDPKPTDLNRLVAGMEDLLGRTAGPQVELDVVAADGLWTTIVDPNQLENALLNLCINGRDAMPDGGRLTVETGNRSLDARQARECDLPAGQYVSLCVGDTGTGMTPDVVAKAFDPFFTTKPLGTGTGLGLSMIYGFARQSGGQVHIESEVGAGSTVCIYLPRHLGEAEDVQPIAEGRREAGSGTGETVLVVDDEALVRMLVVEVLEEAGYIALEAGDGTSGLEIIESDARIDLLVTDIGLPGGMNGRQMAEAARLRRPGLKVLFITGYAENAVIGDGRLDHGMYVATKPFAMEALRDRIRDIIDKG